MAKTRLHNLLQWIILLLFLLFLSAQGYKRLEKDMPKSIIEENPRFDKNKRLLIGSTRPTCTYNECRGCRYRCIAEQVPVEGNDPMNSAYHYKCVCHRMEIKPFHELGLKWLGVLGVICAYWWPIFLLSFFVYVFVWNL